MNPVMVTLIVKALDLGFLALQRLPARTAAQETYLAAIRSMVEEDRNPTTQEFMALYEESRELTEQLKKIVEEKKAQVNTPES